MTIKIGDIDLLNQGLNNEFKIEKLERFVTSIVQKNPNLKINQKDIDDAHNEAIEALKKKYPNMGLSFKKIETDNEK